MVYSNLYSFFRLINDLSIWKNKAPQLLLAGVLPVVKVGRQYVTSDEAIQRWVLENAGKEILY